MGRTPCFRLLVYFIVPTLRLRRAGSSRWPNRTFVAIGRPPALALILLSAGTRAATFSAGNEAELIQAINDANAAAGADTIDVTAPITLSAALPTITDALTIEGIGGERAIMRDDTGSNACSPSATNAFRLLDANADLALLDLSLQGGCNLADQGGALRIRDAALHIEAQSSSPAIRFSSKTPTTSTD